MKQRPRVVVLGLSEGNGSPDREAIPMASKIDAIVQQFYAMRFVKPRGWNRDGIIGFFARKSGESFLTLPAYSDAELSPESIARNAPKGWTVPAESFTRKVDGQYAIVPPDESLKNSLRAFLRDNVLPNLPTVGGPAISPENVELHLTGFGEDATVVIYRRK
jgi:hypothetical protein